jgi:charged multivesicular body protein 7
MAIGDFVVLSNVEVAAAQILKRMASHTSVVDRILSRTEFLTRFGDVLGSEASLSQSDLDILLVHLVRDKQTISYTAQTIKFKADTESVPTPITQEDTAIANLRDTLAKISAQIPALEHKIAETDAASREAVKNKQMVQAKAALRSKKLAESALHQRTDIVLQLEGVYAQLQQAADQVEIVAAMKEGALALKSLNMKVGGAEGVSDVVDMLREEMATQEEITNIISEDGGKVDEGEIEDEFEALEKAEREKQEAKEREEREKREREEAEKTAARLAELEQLEKERKEKEQEQEQEQEQRAEEAKAQESEEKVEEEILHTSQDLSRLSFDGTVETENGEQEKEKERQPVPA